MSTAFHEFTTVLLYCIIKKQKKYALTMRFVSLKFNVYIFKLIYIDIIVSTVT